MARKRMFDIEIINQDSFFELPMDAKALYFLLGMEADDEGFITPKKVLRLYGGTEDSIKILIAKNYLIPFKSGVVVITDWKRNNYLDKKRIKDTIYLDEKKQLNYDEEKEKYILNCQSLTNVKQMLNEYSIEENRIEEYSIEKNNKENEVVVVIDNNNVITDIINYMNNVLNTNYKSTTESTKKFIRARLNEGFTLDQFKKVIDKKYNEWGQDKTMAKFLRPETLFGTKFESYLNQQEKKKTPIPEWLGKNIESTIDKTENKEFEEFIEEFRKE